MDDWQLQLAGIAHAPSAEKTPLLDFLGVFLQVVTTHHQPVIKPFGLSAGESPLKTPSLQSHPSLQSSGCSQREERGVPAALRTPPSQELPHHLICYIWLLPRCTHPLQADV